MKIEVKQLESKHTSIKPSFSTHSERKHGELEDYGLKLVYNDGPEALPVDFAVSDEEDNIAWVWGKDADNIEWECAHPSEAIEYEDDETVGECLLCGATCDWHTEKDFDGANITRRAVPHEWHIPERLGGMLAKLVEEEYGSK